jgi:hypothetical protein
MKKLLFILLLLPFIVKAQIPAVNDSTALANSGAAFTASVKYGLYNGHTILYLRLGTSNKWIAVAPTQYIRDYYPPSARTLTINGVTYDLSADRTWSIAVGGVTSFNGRTGAITPLSTDYSSFYLPVNNPVYTGDLSGPTATLSGLLTSNINANHNFYNTSDKVTNFERASLNWSGNIFNINTSNGGTGVARNINIATGGAILAVNATPTGGLGYIDASRSTSGAITTFSTSGTSTSSSGTPNFILAANTVNQTGTAGYNAIKTSVYEQALGSGTKYLLNLGTNSAANNSGTHTAKFTVDNAGNTVTVGSVTATGGFIGNASTVTNGVYTTTFNGLGDARYLQLTGGALSGGLNGTTANFTGKLSSQFYENSTYGGTSIPGDGSFGNLKVSASNTGPFIGLTTLRNSVNEFRAGSNAGGTAFTNDYWNGSAWIPMYTANSTGFSLTGGLTGTTGIFSTSLSTAGIFSANTVRVEGSSGVLFLRDVTNTSNFWSSASSSNTYKFAAYGTGDVYSVDFPTQVMSFVKSPIVPTPTTGTQAVNKNYVDRPFLRGTPPLTLIVSTDYIATATGAYTLPIMGASVLGDKYAITIKNQSAGSITIAAGGGDFIYTTTGTTSIVLAVGDSVKLMPDGVFWNVE